jgi:glycosyltransferase involved in cell wall biosynthesis
MAGLRSVAGDVPVTLVVPVKDEEASLAEFWDSVSWQRVGPTEIVFVDAGSADRTAEILDGLRERDSRVRVMAAPGAYPGTARNVGIEAAAQSVIALADCGTLLSPVWLEELVRAFNSNDGCEVVYGSFEPSHHTPPGRWHAIAFLPPVRARDGGLHRGETVSSLLVTKEAWSRAGWFPPWRAAEDLYFLARLRDSGAKSAVAPRAIAYWRSPDSVGAVFRKLTSYSRHNVWAGQQRHWHHGLARLYGASLIGGIAACLVSGRRHVAGFLGATLLTMVGARTAERLWAARRTESPVRAISSGGALGVALMVLVGDVATFVGWLGARLRRPPAEYR